MVLLSFVVDELVADHPQLSAFFEEIGVGAVHVGGILLVYVFLEVFETVAHSGFGVELGQVFVL